MHGMMEIVRIAKIEMVRLMVDLFPIFYFQSNPYFSSSFYPLLKLFPIYAIRTISVFAMQLRIANSISNVYYLCLSVQYIQIQFQTVPYPSHEFSTILTRLQLTHAN